MLCASHKTEIYLVSSFKRPSNSDTSIFCNLLEQHLGAGYSTWLQKGQYIIICQSICPRIPVLADSLKTNQFRTGQKKLWVGEEMKGVESSVDWKGELMGRLVGADSGLWEWLWTMGLCPCCARACACAMCTIAARLLFVSELCAKQLRQVNDIAKSSSSCFRAVPSRPVSVCMSVCLSTIR